MPKVLLVEDDNNLREIFEMRLQAEGYQTVTAGNGEEGLTVAMQQKPDLIICDVMMPKLSGFEMLETLRTAPEGKDVKVIMMTALGQAEDRSRGEHLGVVKYLVKSQATLEDFARVVKEVLPPDAGNQTKDTVQNNQQAEGNKTMQDNTTPTNPATPPVDPAPADDPMTTPPAPMADPAAGDQQSTAQEQSTVNEQVNSFVASTPAADAPADSGTPASDSSANPMSGASDSAGMPAAGSTSTDAPAMPPATPPADPAPATPPESETPPTPPASPTGSTI